MAGTLITIDLCDQ